MPEINGRIWVLNNDRLSPIEVQLGITDGTANELLTAVPTTPAPRPSLPSEGGNQVAELRRQVAQLDDSDARQRLELLIQRLEADRGPVASQVSPSITLTTAALDAGAQLVTGVTTPTDGASTPSRAGGSPLIPQFGRGRRR